MNIKRGLSIVLISAILSWSVIAFSSALNYDKELLAQGIKFVFPAGWFKDEVAKKGEGVCFKHPEDTVYIVVNFPKDTDPDTFSNNFMAIEAMTGVRGRLADFHSDICHIIELPCVTSTGISKIRLYYCLNYEKLIEYSFSYSSIDVENFDKYLPEFEAALDTFELVK